MLNILNNLENPYERVSEKKNQKIIAFADWHIGGELCYLPSNAYSKRGALVHQSKHQMMMEKNLLEHLEKEGTVDGIILGGDMVEGRNTIECGLDLRSTDMDLQVNWAVGALTPIIKMLKPTYILVMPGSGYHVKSGGYNADYQIARLLSLTFPDIQFYYESIVMVKIGELNWYLHHNLGGNYKDPILSIGAFNRKFGELHNNAFEHGIEEPDVLGCGHIHLGLAPTPIRFGANYDKYGMVIPSMKLGDTFTSSGPLPNLSRVGYLSIQQYGKEVDGIYHKIYRPHLEK